MGEGLMADRWVQMWGGSEALKTTPTLAVDLSLFWPGQESVDAAIGDVVLQRGVQMAVDVDEKLYVLADEPQRAYHASWWALPTSAELVSKEKIARSARRLEWFGGQFSTTEEAAVAAVRIGALGWVVDGSRQNGDESKRKQLRAEFSHLFGFRRRQQRRRGNAKKQNASSASAAEALEECNANEGDDTRANEVVRAAAAWAKANAAEVEFQDLKAQWFRTNKTKTSVPSTLEALREWSKAQAYHCACGCSFPSASKFYGHVGMNKSGSCRPITKG